MWKRSTWPAPNLPSKRAEETLAKGVPKEQDALFNMEAALRRSNLRLDVVRRYRKNTNSFLRTIKPCGCIFQRSRH